MVSKFYGGFITQVNKSKGNMIIINLDACDEVVMEVGEVVAALVGGRWYKKQPDGTWIEE